MIPGTRPDLQHPLPGPQARLLEHDRDHRRRGDRLAAPDRQRDIRVRVVAVFRPDERFSRDREESVPHSGVADVAGREEAVDHPLPFGSKVGRPSHRPCQGRRAP